MTAEAGELVLSKESALEVLAFLVTAARTQTEEAAEYGPMRLLMGARLLAERMIDGVGDDGALSTLVAEVAALEPVRTPTRDRDTYLATLDDDRVWRAQVALMQAAVATVTDEPVDVVYSAEDYGHELAHRFDAKFEQMDRPRGRRSGTAVRRDLAGSWDELAPATRAGLATRVVVVGAESTGTTTIATLLADHYRARGGVWERTQWVAEYGREYTETKWEGEKADARTAGTPEPALDEMVWTEDDFDHVAREQTRREERAARTGSPVLICDTDAFATSVWERRYLGSRARTGQQWSVPSGLPRRDVYLLTDHIGVPWCDDGLREGDLGLRSATTGWFGRYGARWLRTATGPMPGPPPPCGMQKVLCRFRWETSAPNSPGLASPTSALRFAPST